MFDHNEIMFAHVPYLRTRRYKPRLISYGPRFTYADYKELRACGFAPSSIRSIRAACIAPPSPLKLAIANYTTDTHDAMRIMINSKLYARITVEPDDYWDEDGNPELVTNPRKCPTGCITFTDDQLERILGGHWRESLYHLHIPWDSQREQRAYYRKRGVCRADVEILARAWLRANLEEAYYYIRNFDEHQNYMIDVEVRDSATNETLGTASLGGICYEDADSMDAIALFLQDNSMIEEAIDDMKDQLASKIASYPDLLESLA